MSKFTKYFLLISLAIIIAVGLVGVAKAAGGKPFGGQILYVQYCHCTNNYFLVIGPPVGGNFIFQPGVSKLYQFGQIFRVGPWTLGTWSAPAVCVFGHHCNDSLTGKLIEMVGTSQ